MTAPIVRSTVRDFLRYHEANPHIYELFLAFARQARRSGRNRFGGRMIEERIRWYTMVERRDMEGYKISSRWTPFYVRLIEHEYPEEFAGFFSKRHGFGDELKVELEIAGSLRHEELIKLLCENVLQQPHQE